MVLFILALGARPADACSCADVACAELLLSGAELAADHAVVIVPNPSESCDPAAAADYATLRQDGAEIAAEVAEEGGVYWITPEGGWEPGGDYAVVFSLGQADDTIAETPFTVGEANDEEAPPTPTIRGAERWVVEDDGKNCGDADYIGFELEGTADEAIFYEVAYAPEGEDLASAPSLILAEEGASFVGNGGCDANAALEPGPYQVRVRAIDAAGNASAWSDAASVADAGCGGCASGGSKGSILGMFLGFLALRGRRIRAG